MRSNRHLLKSEMKWERLTCAAQIVVQDFIASTVFKTQAVDAHTLKNVNSSTERRRIMAISNFCIHDVRKDDNCPHCRKDKKIAELQTKLAESEARVGRLESAISSKDLNDIADLEQYLKRLIVTLNEAPAQSLQHIQA